MLSRDAERVYWMARYIERVEDSAVLLNAFSHTILDMPVGMEMGWELLINITSSGEAYFHRYKNVTERNVVKFLLADDDNGGSVYNSVWYARENARSARDLIPLEGWEILNELYLMTKDAADKSISRKYRYAFLSDVVGCCHQFNGLMESTITRDQTHTFLELGKHIERADMTSRILDVGAGFLLQRKDTPLPFDTLLWMHMLESLNALVMYRRKIGPRITEKGVLQFLISELQFPRSVAFCVRELEQALDRLPRNEESLRILAKSAAELDSLSIEEINARSLHTYLDELQKRLIQLHEVINSSWFETDARESSTVQTQMQI